MEPRCGLLCLLLLVFTDISYSAAPTCKAGCVGANNNVLKLREGITYVYDLESNTETSIPKTQGPNGESAKLSLRASVEVHILPQCSALIRLNSVQITGPDDKKFGSLSQLEANPLRVSFNGGALSSQVCTVPEDDYTSLNIKRAVASLLQLNTAESTTIPQEVDVFGACSTAYDVRKDGDVTVVRKTRDLNKCAYRENIRQEIFSIPTSGNSELQSIPLLDPTFEAEIRVNKGIVESAIARETYLLRPFADKTNGARTKATTRLTLKSQAAAPEPGRFTDTTKEPRSIIFENPHEVVSSSIQSVLAALHKVADNTVGIDAATNVAELVAIIRRASADDLLSVYGQVKAGAGFKNKNLAKKVFTDALFHAASGDSVAVAAELLKSREITGNDARLWYLSFALARHASSSALEKATSLLDNEDLPKEAYLGVGALAGKYCREHLCENVPQFEALLSKLAAPLSKPVPASRSDETKLVGSLKSLRNVKRLTEEVAGKVAAVIKESKAPTRVRVAALETAAGDACKNKLQKAAAEILNNKEEDSELRIKAYLVLVECPNAKTANKLSEFLEAETVNQVGAFITAHLRNLRATAKEDRQAAKALLQNVKPRRRFPFDIRKFSQNYELSYDIDALGSAASIDSNVIFSQKSYLPRSASLNLTTEVFGHSFNLFEISGRAENLERVLEKFLGPKGYLRNTKPEDIFRDGQSELKGLKELLQEKYRKLSRARRSVTRDNINSFDEKVKLRNSELDDNIDVDISLRLLGNELMWLNLGEKAPITPEQVIDKVSSVLEKGFGQVKDFDKQIQNHAVFLDTELAYPTASGLAVKLTATGTSVVHLKVAGSLDLPALLKNPKNGQAKVEVRPSASVQVVGHLSVDGFAVEAGVKLATTLHSATGSEITVKLLDGQGIDLNIGLPIKESDILTVSTEVLVAVRERGQAQVSKLLDFQVPRKDLEGCFDQLLPIVGLTLCGKVGFPSDPTPLTTGAAFYPLNGHSKLSLRLVKEDESLTSYHFRLQYNLRDPTNRRIEALIETPGSSIPREISFLAEAKTVPNKEINIKIVTPIYNFRTQALITDSNAEYSLSGLAELEGIFSYKARAGLLINGATYTPILEYTPIDGTQPKTVNVEGTVTVQKSGPGKRVYTFNNVRVISPQGQLSLDGTVTKDTNLFQTDLKLGYDKETVGIKTKLQRQGDNNLKVVAEISPSQYPDFGFGVKYEYQRDKTHVENSLAIVHGRDLNSKQSKLSIFQQIAYNIESGNRFDISTKNSLTYPLFGVEGKLEGAVTQKSFHYDLLLGYEKNTITSKLNAKTGINKPGDYEIDFSAAALDHGVKAEAKREIVAPNKSKFSNTLVLTPGGKYSLIADVTHQLDKNNVDTRLELTAQLEGVADPYKLDIGLILNPASLEAHSKIGIGASKLLDAEIKQKRTDPKSGSFRLNLRNALESSGEYRRAEGKASANVLINIIPIARKIKGTADLAITGVKHVGTIEILYDADKDPNKKLLIQTDTDVTSRSINSKNKIAESGREVLLNFNGEAVGRPGKGGVSGGYDVTLSNGIHLVARGKQALNIIPSNSDGELFLEFAYSLKKGTPLTKFTLDTYAKNVDPKRYAFDTKLELSQSCENGDIYYKQAIKSTPSEGKLLVEVQNSLGGSRLGDYQYNGKTKATLSRSEVSYHASASLGEKYSVDVQGKLHPGVEDKTHGLEQTVVITTPVDNAKEIKLVSLVRFVQGDETRPCQMKFGQELVLNGKSYKVSSEAQGTKKDGNLKITAVTPGDAPYTGQIRYKHNHDNEVIKSEVGLDAGHGDKTLNLNLKADYTKGLTLLNVQLTGATPFEKAKKIDATLSYKKVSSTAGNAELKVNVNDEVGSVGAKYDFSSNHYLLDTNALVNGGKYRYYWKFDKKTSRSGNGEGQMVWASNGGGVYDWSIVYDMESLENFLVVVKANSEKFKLNKLKIEIGNRPTKSGAAKRMNLAVQDKEGKIVSGSASYAIKENENGYSIEGKGTVSVKNENFPLTYKISETRLSKNVNNEVGRQFVTSVDFVKGKYTHDFKLTDKEFRSSQVTCWDKKCAESEIISSVQTQGLAKSQAQLSLKASNSIPQFPIYKLEISNKIERDGLLGSSETTATLRDTTYSVRTYVKATDAGVIVTVPTREIAAIANYQLPERKQDGVVAKLDASLYLDRQKNPADKATLTVEGSVKKQNQQAIASFSTKLNHPSLQRDLSVKGEASVDLGKNAAKANLDVDVLNKKSQKISLSAEVEQVIVESGRNFTAKAGIISKGLVLDLGATAHAYGSRSGVSAGAFAYYVDDKNLRKDAGALISASPKNLAVIVKVPGHTLVDGEANINIAGDVKTLDAELTIAEGETAQLKASVTGLREIKASLSPKSDPKRSLSGLISLSSDKLELRADRLDSDKSEPLFFVILNLDEAKLFKIDYDISTENIKKSVQYFEKLGKELIEKLRAIADSLSKELNSELINLAEALKKAQPNLKALIQQYQDIFKTIREELEKDVNYQKLAEILKKIFGGSLEVLEAQIKVILKGYEKISQDVVEIQGKLVDFYKKVSPELIEAFTKLAKIFSDVAKNVLEIGSAAASQILDIIRQNEKDLKLIINNVTESFQDIGRIAIKSFTQLRNEIRDFVTLVLDNIKSLPVYANAVDRIKELLHFEIPPHFFELFEELSITVQEFMPSPELKELAKAIFSYVEKRLKRQPVDDIAELSAISKQASTVVETLLKELKDYLGVSSVDTKVIPFLGLQIPIPLPATAILRLPELGNIRFSPLSLLAAINELPSPLEFYFTYRPTYNPLDQIPPFKAYGLILNSHHFFTFDKKHFAFKGSCSYVLAQDFQDGNFSIVANLENGKLRSLTVADKTDVVELLSDTTVIVNGKAGEFPVNTAEIDGWRRYSSVNLKLKAGVFITKYLAEDIYVIRVSGFYFGRTRGLLGTINNEIYDEFTLPDGHIAKDSAEFGNAYKLTECAAVPELKPTATHVPDCTTFFTSDSSLRNYFGFLSPEPYREACDLHSAMMPAAARKAACEVATAYVAALRQEGTLFASVPAECAQCSVAGKQLELGQSEQVTSPTGKADVVLVFEQSSQNEAVFKDLVTPLIATLATDLKEKTLTDVEFALIGYGGPNQKWPQHYGNNGKVTYEGKSDNIQFSDSERLTPPYDTLLKKIKFVQKFINIELGRETLVTAMNEANAYPFRQGAAKIIVLINSTPCSKSPIFPFSLQVPRTMSIYRYYRQHGLNFFIVSPLAGLALESPDAKPKAVVGFDSEKVYYLSEKKEIEGKPEDRAGLSYQDDLCLSFSQYYGGAAFSSQNLVDAKPEQKKKFVEIVSQRIVKGAVQYATTEDCVCTLKMGLFPQTQCTVASKELKGR